MLVDGRTGEPVVPNGSLGFRYTETGVGRWNLDLDGVSARPVHVPLQRAKFDATLVLRRTPGGLAGVFEHRAAALPQERAADLLSRFDAHLRALAETSPAGGARPATRGGPRS